MLAEGGSHTSVQIMTGILLYSRMISFMLSVFLVVAGFHLLAVSYTGISDIKLATSSPGIGKSDGHIRRQAARVLLL